MNPPKSHAIVYLKQNKEDRAVERFFHVDSEEKLERGAQLVPRPIPEGLSDPMRECFKGLFPLGVSSWGFAYLFESHGEGLIYDELSAAEQGLNGEERNKAIRRARNRVIELIFELVRINWAPERPSRLASVFGYDNLAVAEEFRSTRCTNPKAPIWEIQAEQAFSCDSSCMVLTDSIPLVVVKAKQYWSGRISPGCPPVDQEHLLSGEVHSVAKCG